MTLDRDSREGSSLLADPDADRLLREVLDAVVELVVIERAVRDEQGAIVDFEIVWMNAAQIDAAARPRSELIGHRVSELYPSLAEGELMEGYRRVIETGVPLVVPAMPYEDEIDGATVQGNYMVQASRVAGDLLVVASLEISDRLRERARLAEARATVAVERTMAEELQRALLPTGLPQPEGWALAARYRPAAVEHRVGGDWYDAFEIDPGALVVVVGDVAGHGIESAALMAQARNALRGIAYQLADADPAAMLRGLNRLAAGQWGEQFITLLVMTIDPRTGTTRYSRAGHPPALLLSSTEAKPLDGVNGPIIGPFADATYTTTEIVIEPGERVVLYTDGLVERRDEMITDGLDRLAREAQALQSLPPSMMCERLEARMLGIGREHDDDVCIVTLDREREER
jgi:serine phosphatase RsbU (regulator of sigma subunit)